MSSGLSVAVCGLEVDGKWPLIKFKRNVLAGYWGLPGGKFDAQEFLPQAAEREMAEEIEQPVVFDEYLGVVDELVVSEGAETKRVTLYICRMQGIGKLEHRRIDKPEGTIDWFSVAEIEEMKDEIVASDYRMLHDLLLGDRRGYFACRLTMQDGPPRLDRFEQAGQDPRITQMASIAAASWVGTPSQDRAGT